MRTCQGAFVFPILGLKQLRTLELRDTKVSDAGLAHLSGLKQLEDLNLRRTQVTDAGVQKHVSHVKTVHR